VIRIARGKGAVRLGPDAVGKSAFELFADAPQVLENLRRALAGETLATEGENDHVWWETRYMPLREPGGEIAGVVGVTMDATARKRAEEELREANGRLERTRNILAGELKSTSQNVAELAAQFVDQQRDLRHALDAVRSARAEAARSGEAADAFLGMLSDEIRAPLAALRREAEAASRAGSSSEDRAAVARVGAAASRLADVVNAMLGYAEVKSGRAAGE